MRRTFVLAAVCMLLSAAGVRPAAAQPAGKPPDKPGPEHQRLGYFVGKWTSEGDMKPGPMGPGGKITSTDSCEWFEGRFAVLCRYDGKGPMGPSKGLGVLGYSTEEKVYTYYGVDSTPMAMTSIPRGTVQGNTWTYTDEGMMGGQKVKSRVTLTELSPTSYTFKMEIQGPDGKWATAMESKNTKVQ
jgi:Protein of unknown function (DUF1579)